MKPNNTKKIVDYRRISRSVPFGIHLHQFDTTKCQISVLYVFQTEEEEENQFLSTGQLYG